MKEMMVPLIFAAWELGHRCAGAPCDHYSGLVLDVRNLPFTNLCKHRASKFGSVASLFVLERPCASS